MTIDRERAMREPTDDELVEAIEILVFLERKGSNEKKARYVAHILREVRFAAMIDTKISRETAEALKLIDANIRTAEQNSHCLLLK